MWSATPGSARPPSSRTRWPNWSSSSAACSPWPIEKARTLFGIDPNDLGRPFQDLQISYRPADLRSSIDRAYQDRRPAKLAEVEWSPKAGEVSYLDIHVVPLLEPGGSPIGASVTFVDATVSRRGSRRNSRNRTGSWRSPTRNSSPPTRSWRP